MKTITTLKLLISLIILITSTTSCDLIESAENSKKGDSKKIYNGVRKNYLKGKLASTVTYKDSLKNGPAINYYSDGKVNMEFNYKNNQKEGKYVWYYETGKIYLEGNYKEGEKDGLFKMYRENESLKSEMPWSNGAPCVGLKEYTQSGKLKPTPKIIISKVNTVKLNGKAAFHFKFSNESKSVKFYEGKVDKNNSFDPFYPEIKGKKGKATLIEYVPKNTYMMKTLSIIGYQKTKDKNFYVVEKKINVSLENR